MASYSPDGSILSCGRQVNTCLFDTDLSYLKGGGSRIQSVIVRAISW